MIDKVSKKDCVGCKACGDICASEAISYEVDEKGFWYPHIDMEKCVDCGLCDRACPALQLRYSTPDNFVEPKVYKVIHKDRQIRFNSTSGALYYGLADVFLRRGGYIAGCVFENDWKGARHVLSHSHAGLRKIMRTKYCQSDTQGIYKRVGKLLDAGEKVLFCGSPCQVSALLGFLGREYENLYMLDFICRGMNSPLAFRKFIEELEERYKSKVSSVHLKNKSRGWTNLGTYVTFENGRKYYGSRDNDAWLIGHNVLCLFMRQSCGNCKYKTFPRIADITMGDFWGLHLTSEEEWLGVSVAMVNSRKGERLFREARDAFSIEESTLEVAKRGNPMIENCVEINPAQDEFFQRVKNEPFSKIVWEIQGSTRFKRLYRVARDRARRIVKMIMEL